jgi:hypothetical protein
VQPFEPSDAARIMVMLIRADVRRVLHLLQEDDDGEEEEEVDS